MMETWTRTDDGFCTESSDLFGPISLEMTVARFLGQKPYRFDCPTGNHQHTLDDMKACGPVDDPQEWTMICRVGEPAVIRIFND